MIHTHLDRAEPVSDLQITLECTARAKRLLNRATDQNEPLQRRQNLVNLAAIELRHALNTIIHLTRP